MPQDERHDALKMSDVVSQCLVMLLQCLVSLGVQEVLGITDCLLSSCSCDDGLLLLVCQRVDGLVDLVVNLDPLLAHLLLLEGVRYLVQLHPLDLFPALGAEQVELLPGPLHLCFCHGLVRCCFACLLRFLGWLVRLLACSVAFLVSVPGCWVGCSPALSEVSTAYKTATRKVFLCFDEICTAKSFSTRVS